jgi:hypothetical protein
MRVCPCGGATRAPQRALVERHRHDIKLAVARHDLLVDLAPGSSLFDLLRLNRELEGLLRRLGPRRS